MHWLAFLSSHQITGSLKQMCTLGEGSWPEMEYVKDGTQKLSALAEGEVEKEGQKLEGRGSGLETGTQLQRRSA